TYCFYGTDFILLSICGVDIVGSLPVILKSRPVFIIVSSCPIKNGKNARSNGGCRTAIIVHVHGLHALNEYGIMQRVEE
ncbi:unnamed protein product, partial [Allacma fusca]